MISAILIALSLAVADAEIYAEYHALHADVEEFTRITQETGYTVHGLIWSTRREGRRIYGCVWDDHKYEIGEEFISQFAKFRCTQNGNTVILEPIACVLSGKILAVEEKVKHDKFFFQCTKQGEGIALVVTGCSDPTGQEVPVGSTYQKGKFIHACKGNQTKVFTEIIACIVDGQFLGIGRQMRSGDYYVGCKRTGPTSVKIVTIGCSDEEGNMLNYGDKTARGPVLYECTKSVYEGRIGFRLVPVGCIAKDYRTPELGPRAYLFGETWLESYKEGISYTMLCRQEDQVVGPLIIGCNFHLPSGTESLQVGCGRITHNKLLVCKSLDCNRVMARTKTIGKSTVLPHNVFEALGVERC